MATWRVVVAISGIVVVLGVSACRRGEAPAGDQEPPLILYFEAGGKRIPIEIDKPFSPEALSGMKTATLRVEPYRVFPYAGISFRYPRSYSFAANSKNQGTMTWTLSGDKFLIIVEQFPGRLDHETIRKSVATEMKKRYASAKSLREVDAKLELDGATLKGRRIEVMLASIQLYQDLFSFAAGDSSIVLILQDRPQADGKPSADRIAGEVMFRESLRLPAQSR
jgi:hypothetical protein